MNKEGLRNFASRAAFAGALVGLAHAPAIVDTQSNNGRIDTHIVALSPDIHPVYAAERLPQGRAALTEVARHLRTAAGAFRPHRCGSHQ